MTKATALGRTIEELGRSRGFTGLEELAEALVGATGEDYTAAELADWPRSGFGDDLQVVLHLDAGERERLVDAVLARINEPDEDLVHITPTIIYRLDRGVIAAAVVEHEDGRALCVFRSEEEAEKYRTSTGKYPESEGFKMVCVNHEALKTLLELHGCTHVAMPEVWTGEGNVDFFTGPDFIGMLEESVPA